MPAARRRRAHRGGPVRGRRAKRTTCHVAMRRDPPEIAQPHASEAAALCTGGCGPVCWRLQP
eukprot:scaffold22375_cov21-Phaeocystis_antarctica.AAC.1